MWDVTKVLQSVTECKTVQYNTEKCKKMQFSIEKGLKVWKYIDYY